MYHRRMHPIEAIFGHLKYNLGYTQFLLRGLEKVKGEFTLMCLTYNLRKLANRIHFVHNWLNFWQHRVAGVWKTLIYCKNAVEIIATGKLDNLFTYR